MTYEYTSALEYWSRSGQSYVTDEQSLVPQISPLLDTDVCPRERQDLSLVGFYDISTLIGYLLPNPV